MKNIRSRLRKQGIKCVPWRLWRGEISLLPVSAQTLFRIKGLEIDILEIELRNEQWLGEDECLLDCLRDPKFLKRGNPKNNYVNDENDFLGDYPSNFTEEDFLYHFGNKD